MEGRIKYIYIMCVFQVAKMESIICCSKLQTTPLQNAAYLGLKQISLNYSQFYFKKTLKRLVKLLNKRKVENDHKPIVLRKFDRSCFNIFKFVE